MVHSDVAARAQQIAIFDCLVHGRQIIFQVLRWRFLGVERIQGFGKFHEAVKVVLLLKHLLAIFVLALCLLKLNCKPLTVEILRIPTHQLVTGPLLYLYTTIENRTVVILCVGIRSS